MSGTRRAETSRNGVVTKAPPLIRRTLPVWSTTKSRPSSDGTRSLGAVSPLAIVSRCTLTGPWPISGKSGVGLGVGVDVGVGVGDGVDAVTTTVPFMLQQLP